MGPEVAENIWSLPKEVGCVVVWRCGGEDRSREGWKSVLAETVETGIPTGGEGGDWMQK